MKTISYVLVSALAFSITISSCTQKPPKREHASTYALQDPHEFTSEVVSLPLEDNQSKRFGIKNCVVFQHYQQYDNWQILFKPAPHPLPQQCIRERLEFDGEYIQIEIGTQALGAGGCCTNYAAYRSRDGKNWEIRPATSITEWRSLDAKE